MSTWIVSQKLLRKTGVRLRMLGSSRGTFTAVIVPRRATPEPASAVKVRRKISSKTNDRTAATRATQMTVSYMLVTGAQPEMRIRCEKP